jgi:hypothetical protein
VIEALAARRPVTLGSGAPIAADHFERGKGFEIKLPVHDGEHRLHYRHVNQAERWQSVAMAIDGTDASAEIPAEYTDSPYHLQYFISSSAKERISLTPGLSSTVSNQPYFVVKQS